MYLTALRICLITIAVSSLLKFALFSFFFWEMYCSREVPQTFSKTRQRIFSSSYTPQSLAMFQWSSSLKSLIQFSRAVLSFGFSIRYLMIFLAAQILPVLSYFERQTSEKLPYPIFLMIWNPLEKPLRLHFMMSALSHCKCLDHSYL